MGRLSRARSHTRRPFAISAPDSRTPRPVPLRARDRLANSRRNVINLKRTWSRSKRSTRPSAMSLNALSTSSLDTKRFPGESREQSSRKPSSSSSSQTACLRCDHSRSRCYGSPCRNELPHDNDNNNNYSNRLDGDDAETMTSSTLQPATLPQPPLHRRPSCSSNQDIYLYFSFLFPRNFVFFFSQYLPFSLSLKRLNDKILFRDRPSPL